MNNEAHRREIIRALAMVANQLSATSAYLETLRYSDALDTDLQALSNELSKELNELNSRLQHDLRNELVGR